MSFLRWKRKTKPLCFSLSSDRLIPDWTDVGFYFLCITFGRLGSRKSIDFLLSCWTVWHFIIASEIYSKIVFCSYFCNILLIFLKLTHHVEVAWSCALIVLSLCSHYHHFYLKCATLGQMLMISFLKARFGPRTLTSFWFLIMISAWIHVLQKLFSNLGPFSVSVFFFPQKFARKNLIARAKFEHAVVRWVDPSEIPRIDSVVTL